MVLEGIQAAIKGGVTHILVGSDSTLLVDTLNKQKNPIWRLKTDYNSIQQLLRNFEVTQITHNHREVMLLQDSLLLPFCGKETSQTNFVISSPLIKRDLFVPDWFKLTNFIFQKKRN